MPASNGTTSGQTASRSRDWKGHGNVANVGKGALGNGGRSAGQRRQENRTQYIGHADSLCATETHLNMRCLALKVAVSTQSFAAAILSRQKINQTKNASSKQVKWKRTLFFCHLI